MTNILNTKLQLLFSNDRAALPPRRLQRCNILTVQLLSDLTLQLTFELLSVLTQPTDISSGYNTHFNCLQLFHFNCFHLLLHNWQLNCFHLHLLDWQFNCFHPVLFYSTDISTAFNVNTSADTSYPFRSQAFSEKHQKTSSALLTSTTSTVHSQFSATAFSFYTSADIFF